MTVGAVGAIRIEGDADLVYEAVAFAEDHGFAYQVAYGGPHPDPPGYEVAFVDTTVPAEALAISLRAFFAAGVAEALLLITAEE